ncbi:MAG: hypothetical protein KGL37_02405 [Acidobacteriota bacterium]|nr:hypothetical protein [Acidobacteriota bacterium]
MDLDLRTPLGWMFILTGAILTLFGLATNGDAGLYTASLGINANLWWGLALLAVGLILLPFGQRARKRKDSK